MPRPASGPGERSGASVPGIQPRERGAVCTGHFATLRGHARVPPAIQPPHAVTRTRTPGDDAAWRALQAATAALHAQVEATPLMAALMARSVDRATCIEVLQRMLAIHAGWEHANAARLQALPWPWRQRAPVLRADLQALGIRPSTRLLPAPYADDDAQAWGMLYVVEGSALGGRLIARHLRSRLPQVGAVIRHFDGGEPGPGWPAFRAMLEQALPDAPARTRAAAAAQAMFAHFHGQLARPIVVADDAGTATA